jgi:DNA-binding phage protein
MEGLNVARKKVGVDLVSQIKEAIRGSGLSLNQIAERAGVGRDLLSRFMSDQRGLTLKTASAVCEALGLRLTGPDAPEGSHKDN